MVISILSGYIKWPNKIGPVRIVSSRWNEQFFFNFILEIESGTIKKNLDFT